MKTLQQLKENYDRLQKLRFEDTSNEVHEEYIAAMNAYDKADEARLIKIDWVPSAVEIRKMELTGYPTSQYLTIESGYNNRVIMDDKVLAFQTSHLQRLVVDKIHRTLKIEKQQSEMSWERWMST